MPEKLKGSHVVVIYFMFELLKKTQKSLFTLEIIYSGNL